MLVAHTHPEMKSCILSEVAPAMSRFEKWNQNFEGSKGADRHKAVMCVRNLFASLHKSMIHQCFKKSENQMGARKAKNARKVVRFLPPSCSIVQAFLPG